MSFYHIPRNLDWSTAAICRKLAQVGYLARVVKDGIGIICRAEELEVVREELAKGSSVEELDLGLRLRFYPQRVLRSAELPRWTNSADDFDFLTIDVSLSQSGFVRLVNFEEERRFARELSCRPQTVQAIFSEIASWKLLKEDLAANSDYHAARDARDQEWKAYDRLERFLAWNLK